MGSKMKLEKKQHVQVFTRVRPISSHEFRSQIVVECLSSKEVCVRDKNQSKTFTFDRVFGPDSKQIDVYKTVVSPLICEVLQGYNCTVFAYGQTGTGKTFTMVGERSQELGTSWEDDPGCGIIPRTLSHLFDELKIRAEEFTVRVSFLELYNEELCDLLAQNINDDGKNLRLYEDTMKKGSVIVSGLEERTVHNKDDVYAILEAGNHRRQTAPTLMNAQSSRSHTIFTITVHIKVTTPEGEDLIKTGKLNLVDLAGSENIGRSGAVDMRAREAGNINQSLLTLGRVITSLVERTPHVPYRESKLTRILQDSLGGRTKTSIIATVSPALCNIEETLSTFDYAHRARNITNKPEINQKTSKRVLLKEYTEEIERLRRDLIATREKHGVYLASDNYNAMIAERENLNKELISKLNLLKVREEELAKQEEILKNLNMDLFATQNELETTFKELQETKKICLEREDMLNELSRQTDELLKTADEAVADARRLHDRVDRSRRIQEHNLCSAEKFKSKYCKNLSDMKAQTKEFLANSVNDVQKQIFMNKDLLNIYCANHQVLKEKTNVFKLETDNHFKLFADKLAEQALFGEKFINELLEKLKSWAVTENSCNEANLNFVINFSRQLRSHTQELMASLEGHKSSLEKHRNELLEMQDISVKLFNTITDLPVVLTNKVKEQEESLNRYEEKFELLETKQNGLRSLNEEFGRRLLQLTEEFNDRLQIEKECHQALKDLRMEKKHEESNMKNDTVRSIQETIQDACVHSKRAEEIGLSALSSVEDTIESYKLNVLPTLQRMSNNEMLSAIQANINRILNQRGEIMSKVTKDSQSEINRIRQFGEHGLTVISENQKALGELLGQMDKEAEMHAMDIEKRFFDNENQKKNHLSRITEHSEQLFSGIHHRVKEIEVFFNEGIQKDEKTGDTPQRREFNYPRRIVTMVSKNRFSSDVKLNNGIDETSNDENDLDESETM